MSSTHACEVGDHGQEMTTIKIPSTDALEGRGRGREITTPPKAVVTNPLNSQASSIYSRSRRSEAGSLFISAEDFRYNTMISYLYTRVLNSNWIPQLGSGHPDVALGVLLKKSRGNYICYPPIMAPSLLAAVQKLNVEVAFTMRTDMINGLFESWDDGQTELRLKDGSQLQFVESLATVASMSIKKFQYACLVREEQIVLIWHDDLQQIIPHATRLEEKLLSLVWGTAALPFSLLSASGASRAGSMFGSMFGSPNESILDVGSRKVPLQRFDESDKDILEDLDEGESMKSPESLDRAVQLTSAFFVGLGICLIIVLLLGFATSHLIVESLTDGNWTRMAFVAFLPFLLLVGLFFSIVIVTDLFQAFGPIESIKKNSRFFSAIKPSLRRAYAEGFTPPPITIQMPVYKEGLQGVIKPTIASLKEAISHYESHGGTATIFINDDGLQIIPEEEAQARKDFYHDNNIGWVSRPKHGKDGYLRRGKFKKASNMNFALNISKKVEEYLEVMVEAKLTADGTDLISQQDEDEIYKACLERVLKEDPRGQAAGHIRMGELILIIDSDTRVPIDCLLYGAAEMFLSPEVAIIQHITGVMQVVNDYFENGITFFTNLVYTSIRYSIGCGEVAPFVGHNAFLRWLAVQSVGVQEEEGFIAYWSESHVSEDFDIALRLQITGNVVRVASYHNDEFKEGVSLTIYDELARWEKYAYGCSELVFHPMYQWVFKGPFTPLFITFLRSNIVLSSKCTILAYIASYFALASGSTLTLMNYFIIGWFNGDLDKFYMQSWNVFVSLVVVFNIGGNFSLAILRYRLGEKGLLSSLLENFKWMAMFTIFFGGLSFHLNGAILSHLLHINMQWDATAKEKENSNFFQEVPKIFKNFKWMYLCIGLIAGAMIYLGVFSPRGWDIKGVTAVMPMAVTLVSHALVPFVLNPSLMVFNY